MSFINFSPHQKLKVALKIEYFNAILTLTIVSLNLDNETGWIPEQGGYCSRSYTKDPSSTKQIQ